MIPGPVLSPLKGSPTCRSPTRTTTIPKGRPRGRGGGMAEGPGKLGGGLEPVLQTRALCWKQQQKMPHGWGGGHAGSSPRS